MKRESKTKVGTPALLFGAFLGIVALSGTEALASGASGEAACGRLSRPIPLGDYHDEVSTLGEIRFDKTPIFPVCNDQFKPSSDHIGLWLRVRIKNGALSPLMMMYGYNERSLRTKEIEILSTNDRRDKKSLVHKLESSVGEDGEITYRFKGSTIEPSVGGGTAVVDQTLVFRVKDDHLTSFYLKTPVIRGELEEKYCYLPHSTGNLKSWGVTGKEQELCLVSGLGPDEMDDDEDEDDE